MNNATPPVSQAPIASDPAQQGAGAPANSVNSGGNGQDFAAALCNAGPKPARKVAALKPSDAGAIGGQLPAAGNLSPPPAPPVTAGSAAAAAAAATAAAASPANIAGTLGGSSKPGAAAGTAAPAAPISGALAKLADQSSKVADQNSKVADQNPGSAPADSQVAAPGAQGSTSPGTGFGLALGLAIDDSGEADASSGHRAATPAAATGGVAPTKGAATAAAPAASAAQGGAAAGTANKPITAAAATAINIATSGGAAVTTDGSATPSTNPGDPTNTDASAQAVTAAAMSAAATGAVAPGDAGIVHAADLSSSPTNDLAAPATGAVAKGAGGPSGSPVPVPAPAFAISVARPAGAASAKAATAAQAATTLANVSAADKRASGGTGDSLLSGTSGDGALVVGAAQLSVNPTGVADATPTPSPTLKVAAGVETPEFGQGIADRVSWMVDNNLNGAKLQVNPPQLGPIEVRIAVQGSHAQVWLTSHSTVTRDALESSSPKLREMLGAQGFGQVSVDISQRSYQERPAYSQPYDWTPTASRSSSTAAVQSTASSLPRTASGAVDAYA